MKAANTLVAREKQTFSAAITGDSLQNLIKKSVASPEAAARLTGTLISAVAASPQLQQCTPATIVAAALRGEGMGLTLGREYHLIPFGQNCAYVIGYKGLIALCLAGNDVNDMDCVEVREGEWIGRDKRTKRPVFDFSKYTTDEEAAKHPVIGYYAYVEFINGRFRYEYMSVAEILEHAQRYSKAFNLDKYNKMVQGKLSAEETEKLKQGSPYYSSPEIMFKKTVIRKLLNSGYIRLANSAAVKDAMNYDSAVEDSIMPALEIPTVESTGEVIEAAESVEEAPTPTDTEKKPKARQKAKERAESANDEAVNNFFGDAE